MANIRRGEIDAEFGGKRFTLVLTLGALAELEAYFKTEHLPGLAARFEKGNISARDLLAIIGCGVRGGGASLSDEDLAALPVEGGLQGYVRIAAQLLSATFGEAEAAANDFPLKPQHD